MPATQRTRQDRTAHSSAQTLGPVLRHHWQTPSTIAETSKYAPSTPLLHPPPITPAPNSHQITPLRRRQTSMGPLSRAEMGSFDRLPRELFEAILLACTYAMPKHQAASLRLINKEWNAFLRPRICCTLGLDFTRLSRNSSFTPPDMSVLDSLAPFCKSLYIDLRAMRDDQEIDILNNVITKVPPVDTASHELMNSYCMDDTTFTEIEYLDKLSEMLLRCPNVEGLRLNLPFQLMGKNSIVGKFILANSLKAFATRPEEESAPLKKLVIENITDSAIYDLATNPLDLGYLLAVTGNLEHLVLSVRRNELSLRMHSVVGTALCQVLQDAENLHTLCIVGIDKDGETIPITAYESGDYEYADLIIMSLPMMGLTTTSITRLELKNVVLEYTSIMGIAESCALEELYLTDISLVTLQPADMEEDILDILWIGLPNRRQGEGGLWVAPYLRVMLPNLRVCRATSIGYSAFLEGGNVDVSAHDITDPTGRARTLAQRFVEVVMGYEQPAAPDGKHIEYFPPAFFSSKEAPPDKPPMGRGDITSYDVTAYQTAVDNTTSYLLKSIDGLFVDFNGRTTEDLHRIAMLVYSGLKQIHVSQSVSDPFHPTEEYLQMLWSASDTQGEYMDT